MILVYTLLYIILNAILSVIENDKQEELLKLFLLGMLLTPVVTIGYLLYKKKNSKRVHFYYCSECDYVFPVKMKHCPICEEQGKKIKLTPYRSPYRLTKQIRTITL